MKPQIYKLKRYRYRGDPPVCMYCLGRKSIGWTDFGDLGCVLCQDKVDVYIDKNFQVMVEV